MPDLHFFKNARIGESHRIHRKDAVQRRPSVSGPSLSGSRRRSSARNGSHNSSTVGFPGPWYTPTINGAASCNGVNPILIKSTVMVRKGSQLVCHRLRIHSKNSENYICCFTLIMGDTETALGIPLHEHVPQSVWLGSYPNLDLPSSKQPLKYAIVQTIESVSEGEKIIVSSMVCPEWISVCHQYLLYPPLTASKTSQPFYWENSRFLSNRNPKSSWLEYKVHNYLNPHDLKSFDKIKKRLNLLSSGEALTWEESEPERSLGIGQRNKTTNPKYADGAPVQKKSRKEQTKPSVKKRTQQQHPDSLRPTRDDILTDVIPTRMQHSSPSLSLENDSLNADILAQQQRVPQSATGNDSLTDVLNRQLEVQQFPPASTRQQNDNFLENDAAYNQPLGLDSLPETQHELQKEIGVGTGLTTPLGQALALSFSISDSEYMKQTNELHYRYDSNPSYPSTSSPVISSQLPLQINRAWENNFNHQQPFENSLSSQASDHHPNSFRQPPLASVPNYIDVSHSPNRFQEMALSRRRINFSGIENNCPENNSPFELIQRQLGEIIKEQSLIRKIVQQKNGQIPVLQEELASHAAVVATEFEFLPVDSPEKLQSLDVKLGGREQQSLSLILHLAAELRDCKSINDFLRNIFSKIMTPDLGNTIQWKTRQVNGQIISGLKVLPNVLAVIKVASNLWSRAKDLKEKDTRDFIKRCKEVRKQSAYTHREATKTKALVSEKLNITVRQKTDDIQIIIAKKVKLLEQLLEKITVNM